jgi:hypothetical protein
MIATSSTSGPSKNTAEVPQAMSDVVRYPWQQTVMDAFAASLETLPIKINFAERAIAARQVDMPLPDVYERLAIKEALRSLAKLIDQTRLASCRTHFHIRWASGALDWERFDTTLEAEAGAQQLVRPGETYTLEEYADDCSRCGALRGKKATGS